MHCATDRQTLRPLSCSYVSRGLPISTIVIDWQHWVNMGDWTLNPVCWPDPQGMVDTLRLLGIELMITFWPFQTTPSTHWDQFNSSGYLATGLDGSWNLPLGGSLVRSPAASAWSHLACPATRGREQLLRV